MVEILDRVPYLALIPRSWLFQPIDTSEVADRLVELALGSPAGRVPDMGGPEVRTLASLTQAYLAAKGSTKGVSELPSPGKAARAFREGAQVALASERGDISGKSSCSERKGSWSTRTHQHVEEKREC
jgi:uncharacterized protein YbjT (DUF2867 family)